MQIAEREFRPKVVPTLAAAILFAVLLSLGFWQIDRARQKEALYHDFLGRSAAAPVLLTGAAGESDAAAMIWRRTRLHGRWDPARTYLLDNQVHDGQAGYFAYTPLLLDHGVRVLVSRGWVPGGMNRDQAPEVPIPAGEVALEGVVKPAPVTPVLRETPPERLGPDVFRVQQIDLAAIAAANGWTLLPYEVRLDGEEAAFVRDWPVPGSGGERHLGYAFQWFAMAAVLFVIWVAVNLRRPGAAA